MIRTTHIGLSEHVPCSLVPTQIYAHSLQLVLSSYKAKKMSFVVAFGLLVCLTAAHATELSDAKFHCIAFNPATNVGVFRSNMPITPDTKDSTLSPSSYAYLDILELAGEKGLSECNTTSFQTSSSDAEPYILEISLSNSADDKNGLVASRSFWALTENFNRGRLVEWPLGVAGLVPPSRIPKFEWEKVSTGMWAVDQLPSRIEELNSISEEGYANLFSTSSGEPTRPIIVLVHCNAGRRNTAGHAISSQHPHKPPLLHSLRSSQAAIAPGR